MKAFLKNQLKVSEMKNKTARMMPVVKSNMRLFCEEQRWAKLCPQPLTQDFPVCTLYIVPGTVNMMDFILVTRLRNIC